MPRILPLLLCFLPSLLWGQYQSGFQQEYFFGHFPNAQTDALGGTSVALGGNVFSAWTNPAGISQIDSRELNLSLSAPFFILRESDTYFLGYAQKLNETFSAGLSVHQFAMGPSTFDINFGSERYPVDAPKVTNVILSLAAEPIKGLHAGVNLNVFNWKYIDEIPITRAAFFDIGAVYEFAPNANHPDQQLQFGTSLTNTTFSRIQFDGPQGEVGDEAFPAIFRLGATYSGKGRIQLVGANEGALSWLVSVEYMDLLNNEFRTTIRGGTEVMLYDVLAIRLGAYRQSKDNLGNPINASRDQQITHGFGVKIPIRRIFKDRVPFDIMVDYTSLPHPKGIVTIPNFRTFSFRMIWTN
ncbi:MAG: hypothetical protein AAF206_04825 [Bacteroidota bacterium]